MKDKASLLEQVLALRGLGISLLLITQRLVPPFLVVIAIYMVTAAAVSNNFFQ